MESNQNKNASTAMVVLAFATVYIVWGSTYFFIQKALTGFPPFLIGVLRFIAAGLLMMAWCAIKGEKIFDFPSIKTAAVTGLLLLFVGNGVVIWVEQTLPSAMVAIMISSSPIWFILLDKPKWKENLNNRSTIIGLLIGFVGVILLLSEHLIAAFSSIQNGSELIGLSMLVIGTISWAGGSLYSKYNTTGGSSMVNTSWQMLIAGVAFIPGSLIQGEFSIIQWNNIPTATWLSVIYLIFFGSIAAYSAYVWLLKVQPSTKVSTYAYVNPVIAVLLGIFFAKETISSIQIIGLIVILGSVVLINLDKYRKEAKALRTAGV
ncbi:Permease of the drug/metabolite transporter (DMT) superfamily [Dyadobacter koreensis]|uniref:Permease of the drug/metabolite transporter (DMT) superfamily n=1 Tax=Dyadobacter koreensis TaxID=408657 RepID=A0A1H6XU45_9BACT|nr:EamA family transporter [Dyadobacter koreensis]SEJ31696.1 Permease of the drug/metabolite transporter (DMT) superfamily [Dyadobacter koreensis]